MTTFFLRPFQHIIVLSVFLFLAAAAPAQPPAGEEGEGAASSEVTREPFWQADCPGGSFLVALKDISSVSRHTYLVEGGARVIEANIGTSGSLIARFYYIEVPGEGSAVATVNRGMERLKQLTEQAQGRVTGGQSPWQQVIKNYPTTTHAHTVEYRLQSAAAVDAVFADARQAWVQNRGRRITVEGGVAE